MSLYDNPNVLLIFGRENFCDSIGGIEFREYKKPFTWETLNKVWHPEIRPISTDKKVFVSVILQEVDGRIWTTISENEFGMNFAFPVAEFDHTLSTEANVRKTAFEQIGFEIVITGHAGDYETDDYVIRYVYAIRASGNTNDYSEKFSGIALLPLKATSALVKFEHDQVAIDRYLLFSGQLTNSVN